MNAGVYLFQNILDFVLLTVEHSFEVSDSTTIVFDVFLERIKKLNDELHLVSRYILGIKVNFHSFVYSIDFVDFFALAATQSTYLG